MNERSLGAECFDCESDPIARLEEMFVGIVQEDRIALGQTPALRPVFLKLHGVAHARWEPRSDLDPGQRVGVFGLPGPRPAWVRFSSDTQPTDPDLRSTCGIGIKIFDVEGPKLLGNGTTQDFLLQNNDVFFVPNATEMCRFTEAGVVLGRRALRRYLRDHPRTKEILDEMKKIEASVLTATYWSGLPYRFGPDRAVKYKLVGEAPAGGPPPDDPNYLAADLARRLQAGETRFKFYVQFREEDMPVDDATVRWSEEESPPVHVADLILPQQDIGARGQAAYGENLAYNPWHSLTAHEPLGSISDARRVVYEASADVRRRANGVSLEEPGPPRAVEAPGTGPDDDCIVTAAIHPSIGVARVGSSDHGWFYGPEVPDPPPAEPGFYRDEHGALKRQAARFRVYGLNARGDVVAELKAPEAVIEWRVHLANQKAAWYEFQIALDIPEASSAPPSLLRNPGVPDRADLVVDPGHRHIAGAHAEPQRFDSGRFMGEGVYLGELRTDEEGRLVVLGGHGRSASYNGTRAYTFANNETWHDDVSDGPVTARVTYRGQPLPVAPAWVVVAPPNYGPRLKSVRTMWDLMHDVAVKNMALPRPLRPSFDQDIRPIFERMTALQWANAGFAAAFGWRGPFNLSSPGWLERLADNSPASAEMRRVIANNFRSFATDSWSPVPWPWLYGDAMNIPPAETPRQNAALSDLQLSMLDQWAQGDFAPDYDPDRERPAHIEDVDVRDQAATLDRASLEFCLADAFHPGCEMTWPMRHWSMYQAPFRIAHAPVHAPAPGYGAALDSTALSLPDGPLGKQRPGDLTRWMAVPWQTDTASCRSGYMKSYDPYLPTFWPARVPNQVLSQGHYDIVMDDGSPLDVRLEAFASRAPWIRPLGSKSYTDQINNMIERFGDLGVLEVRPGPDGPDFPAEIQVESVHHHVAEFLAAAPADEAPHHADRVDLTDIEKVNRFPDGLRR